jgi:ATP-dependent DNA helicase RecG
LGKLSVTRNPILADLFQRIKLIDKIGSGILRMKTLFPNIKFEIYSNFFKIILFRNVPKNVPKNSEERRDLILEKIKKGINFTKRELADEFNVNDKTIQRDLDKLKNKIEFIGSKKTGKWILK